MASPAHQDDQTSQNRPAGTLSSSISVTLPMVALISIPANAPRKTRQIQSRSRASSLRNPTRRSSA
ncbi:hypothetical protein SVIOM74S_08007 [Streptomyces violarus]